MQIRYSSPITEQNAAELCTELQKACSLRRAYKARFYTVAILRFIAVFIALGQIFMMYFSELKFIFPYLYSILNDFFVVFPESVGVSPYIALPSFVLFSILFSYLAGYFIASLSEVRIVKKGFYDISNAPLQEKKSKIVSLRDEYNRLDRGELTASIIMSAIMGIYAVSITLVLSEGFLTAIVTFICSFLTVFVIDVISSTELISESTLKKINEDVSIFATPENPVNDQSEKKSLITDEEAESIESMTPDEVFLFAKSFLGINTKKCFEIMHIAQQKGSMQAHQFMYSLAHECSYFSKGICTKKSVDGKVEQCFHDDGTWMMCDDYD